MVKSRRRASNMKRKVDKNSQITQATVANYTGRAISFAKWAEHQENAISAMNARNLLLKELRKRKLALGLGRRDKFRILDIGCGSGRDVREFCL